MTLVALLIASAVTLLALSVRKPNARCDDHLCSGAGRLEQDGKSKYCVCEDGFAGPACERNVSSRTQPVVCSICERNGGRCVYSDAKNGPYCVCPLDRFGTVCEHPHVGLSEAMLAFADACT